MKYHPLTEKINNMSLRPLDGVDKIIRQWLKEKAYELNVRRDECGMRAGLLENILQLQQESLKEKFEEYLGSFHDEPANMIEDLAQIAKEHYEK